MAWLTLPDFTAEIARLAEQGDPARVASGAAAWLPALLANPELLTAEQRRSSPDSYAQHLLYVHPAGRFSVVSLVWEAGHVTPVHDHVAWCVVGVYEGEERETSYRLVEPGGRIERTAVYRRPRGSVSCLLPGEAGDIHRVENATDATAISIHVYGADIARLGTSIRSRYAGRRKE